MTLDRLIYPSLAQYLDGLPRGLGSYPAAQTRADFSLILRQHLQSFLLEPSLPAPVSLALQAPYKQGDWIPTTTYVALSALARDRLWQSESAYHQGMLDVATEMYTGPVFRALFVMFGPSLVAMSAAKRWHTLHQGTELVTKKQQKESLDLALTFPPKLFTEVGVYSLGAAFCAIAQACRGKDPTHTLLSLTDTTAEVRIGWTY